MHWVSLTHYVMFISVTEPHSYIVHIFTGSKMTAGTDANVLITMYGEKGDSRERKLDNIEYTFERNK